MLISFIELGSAKDCVKQGDLVDQKGLGPDVSF